MVFGRIPAGMWTKIKTVTEEHIITKTKGGTSKGYRKVSFLFYEMAAEIMIPGVSPVPKETAIAFFQFALR